MARPPVSTDVDSRSNAPGSSVERPISSRELWFALVAGPLPWRDGRQFAASIVLAIGTAALLAATVAATAMSTASSMDDRLLSSLGLVGLLLWLGPELVVSISQTQHTLAIERGRWLIRPIGFTLSLVGAYHAIGAAAVLVFTSAGLESAATLSLVGVHQRLLGRLVEWVQGPLHIGLAIGILGVSVATWSGPPWALRAYLWLLGGAVLAAIASGAAAGWIARIAARETENLAAQQQRDARYFAGWLHDQVSNPVRLLRLRLADGTLVGPAVIAELDHLEAMLRAGQVDHLVESGIARLRDVAQPFLRLAERHGVELADVPEESVADLALTTSQARMASRAIGVLVNNAVQAGAKTISLRAQHQADALVIEVEDDAGGFVPHKIHHGRGLTDLRSDLSGGLDICPTAMGTVIRARVEL